MTDEIFNIDIACEALKITPNIYLRIAGHAIKQTDQDLIDLNSCHEKQDIAGIKAIAHRLKGDYGNLRIDHLAEIASKLNDLAKSEYNDEEASDLIRRFQEQYGQVKKLILQQS